MRRLTWLVLFVACSSPPPGDDGGTAGGSTAGGGAAGGGSAGGTAGGAAGGTAGGTAGGNAGGAAGGAAASSCGTSSQDSGCTGYLPFSDADGGTYQGFPVEQYAGGTMSAAHRAAGLQRAAQVRPLDTAGNDSDAGVYILLSIGYSNATQEFCKQAALPGPLSACDPWTFMGQLATDPRVRKEGLVVMNGAAGGQANLTWDAPSRANYTRVAANLTDAGYSEAQVQIGWLKIANIQPAVALPAPNADAYALERSTANIVRAMKSHYPNLKMVFISSRTYAGWATSPLNPEPYAYEGAFSVTWVVEDQIRQMAGAGASPDAGDLDYGTVAPWIAWGPYLWTDGTRGRDSDGMLWPRSDTEADGTHPSMSGEQKVGTLLRRFFSSSPFTRCWFTYDGGSCQ